MIFWILRLSESCIYQNFITSQAEKIIFKAHLPQPRVVFVVVPSVIKPSEMSSIREEMVTSAVEFLKNPQIADSPLAKKIEFIESKGLNEAEVKEALLRSQGGNGSSSVASQVSSYSPSASQSSVAPSPPPFPDHYRNAPPLPERDWKDYFVMATATAGVSFGLYKVISNYVLPKLLPPSKEAIELDKEAIDREFTRVEALLNTFEEDQKAFYEEQREKSGKIEDTLTEIDAIISKTNEKNLNNEESLKYLKLEIESIKNTLMKNIDSQKSTISSELGSIEAQLDELKKLIVAKPEDEPIRAAPQPSLTTGANSLTSESSGRSSIPHSQSVPIRTQLTTPPSDSDTSGPAKLHIPPATSIPSLKDILRKEKNRTVDTFSKSNLGKDLESVAQSDPDKVEKYEGRRDLKSLERPEEDEKKEDDVEDGGDKDKLASSLESVKLPPSSEQVQAPAPKERTSSSSSRSGIPAWQLAAQS
ncbi:GQ67_05185T0 [Komagataella phaffii]|nr:GQ67_05185T0 [Komagataella phaffii]AOA69877.1 GQ68_05167T0 [Komagataella phaffii GS115]